MAQDWWGAGIEALFPTLKGLAGQVQSWGVFPPQGLGVIPTVQVVQVEEKGVSREASAHSRTSPSLT